MLLQIDDRVWVATQPLKYFGLSVGCKPSTVSRSSIISRTCDRSIGRLARAGR